ncbi:MAG TPA: sigma-54 dependent transcriptional regulator [Kofleriaceae bacterium]|nr:sigma-54 dependent transcriptional regulator [Kofleriaceae bacterium]
MSRTTTAARTGPTVLVVDDHVEMARVVAEHLEAADWRCEVADGGAAAVAAMRASMPDLVITDLRMTGVDGLDVVDAARAIDPEVPVIVMTAFGAIDSAIEAMRRGAWHYLTKPLRLDELRLHAERALTTRRLGRENRSLRAAIPPTGLDALVGRSAPMVALYALIRRVGPSPSPVMIRGESGTGKELVARALHDTSPRRAAPFVAVNCTALPEHLLESELFGHVRGAFTGATAARAGLFVEADGGTLFLDEIGDMAPPLQAKLLRVVQLGEVRPVGSDESRRIDVRLVAATHHDLEERVASGAMRHDLYYRLSVVPIVVPALRDHPEDIPLLAEHFLRRSRERNPHSPVERLAPSLVTALARHRWLGNVRELENLIERLVVTGDQAELDVSHLAGLGPAWIAPQEPFRIARDQMPTLRQLEDEYLEWVLARCDGNKTRAAEILGVDVSTIHRRRRGGRDQAG